jgi:hypothetical protein
VKYEKAYFHCGDHLKNTLSNHIAEIESVLSEVRWSPEFSIAENGAAFKHQAGYNKAFDKGFTSLGWDRQPFLRDNPRLIGDFRKGLVFVEVQFGNSSALYRDYYKFQYGLANGLLSLSVLIVPTTPKSFFPTRPTSVQNMAEYSLAHTCLTVLPINVPALLIGLLPQND